MAFSKTVRILERRRRRRRSSVSEEKGI